MKYPLAYFSFFTFLSQLKDKFLQPRAAFWFVLAVLFANLTAAQSVERQSGKAIYEQIKAFRLTGGAANVSNLVLKRDRAAMTFNGTFYFAEPINGKTVGAVFVGQGVFRAEVPPSEFEKNNVKRLLGADAVESDFKTAVLRFTDDTFDVIGQNKNSAAANDVMAQRLATECEPRVLRETGANISSRLTVSLLNQEQPGFFFAEFDGGKRDRFAYIFDPQTRIPTQSFDINGGEQGIIYSYKDSIKYDEIWMAFYSLKDYERGIVSYSDVNDLVDVSNYDLNVDLRQPKKSLGLKAKATMSARRPGVRAVGFTIGESLDESENQRLKKQLRVKRVRLGDTELEIVQEDWEAGMLVFLPEAARENQPFVLDFELEGDFMMQPAAQDCHYPRSNETWYPRHGYLDRSTFNFTFTHPKRLKIATAGTRLSEQPSTEDKEMSVTKYRMTHPVSLVTFALAPFQRSAETIKWDDGTPPIPIEFNSITTTQIKEDFILAELNNSVRFFYSLFGKYPYENFGAAYHPFAYGQGFPSMMMIPDADTANKYTYAFISHETAHQWWGNIVAWRSYRDQWLSEGFAEYSGVLYTALRRNPEAARNLVNEMRRSLKDPPQTLVGYGKGRLADVGPIILGHRLNTSKTFGAYQALIYNKGALVLRMLHFLLTDPASGNGQAFFDMMKDFVERYRDKTASTDDFRLVANEHFARSPIGKRFNLNDLNWFFRQWVYQTELPSYQMDYKIEKQPDNSFLLTGTITQENVADNWFMPLPIFLTVGGKQASIVVGTLGPKTPFRVKLPTQPEKVELDPQKWVLSEKTGTN